MQRPFVVSSVVALLATLAAGDHALGQQGSNPPGQGQQGQAQGRSGPAQPGQGQQGSNQPGQGLLQLAQSWQWPNSHQAGAPQNARNFYFYPAGYPSRFARWSLIDSSNQNSGMTLAPADAALRAHLKLPEDEGLLVTALEPESPAMAAGIHQNDVLIRLYHDPERDIIKLSRPEDLEAGLKKMAADQPPVFLQLLRNGRKLTIGVEPRVKVSLGPVHPKPPTYWIGVSVAPVESALRVQLQLPDRLGLIVLEVVKDGPAARAGVRVHDILLKFDGVDLTDQAGLTKLVQARGEKAVALELLREGRKQEVKITPDRRSTASVTLRLSEPSTGQFDVVLPGAVVPGQQGLDVELANDLGVLHAWQQGWGDRSGKPSNPEDATSKRLDQLSAQIQELRQAIDAMARAQAKK